MSSKQMETRRSRRGFTLIELLVVVLILAILMAVALPAYLSAVADSQRKTCRANMQTIANAEQAYKTKIAGHTYAPDLATLTGGGDLPTSPICPSAGTYSISLAGGTSENGQTVPAGSLIISCSVGAHGKFAPGYDGE